MKSQVLFHKRVTFLLLIMLALFSSANTWAASAIQGVWRGAVTNSSKASDWSQEEITVSANGNLVFGTFEASAVNKMVSFVPSGGGVATIKVLSLAKRAKGFTVVIKISVEKTYNGYLHQDYTTMKYVADASSCGMNLYEDLATQSYTSDPTGSDGGSSSRAIYRGIMHKL